MDGPAVQPAAPPPPTGRFLKILFAIVLPIGILVGLFWLHYFRLLDWLPRIQSGREEAGQGVSAEPVDRPPSIEIPIEPTNGLITSMTLLYSLNGIVQSITQNEEGNYVMEIQALDRADQHTLTVEPREGVFYSVPQDAPIDPALINPGDGVMINVSLALDPDRQRDEPFVSRVKVTSQ